MITVEEVRSFATTLPRTTEALVHDRVKFHVGPIVYVAFSRDETVMGFAFPKEERGAVGACGASQVPDARHLRSALPLAGGPDRRDRRDRVRELVLDAWRMVVPKRVAAVYDGEV